MRLASKTEYTLTLTDDERIEVYHALGEALDALASPKADDLPHNWRADPRLLRDLCSMLAGH